MPTPDRDQLIRMIDTVMNASGCMADVDGMLNQLERHFPGCDIGRLIFDPPSGKRMTAEQVFDLARRGDDA